MVVRCRLRGCQVEVVNAGAIAGVVVVAGVNVVGIVVVGGPDVEVGVVVVGVVVEVDDDGVALCMPRAGVYKSSDAGRSRRGIPETCQDRGGVTRAGAPVGAREGRKLDPCPPDRARQRHAVPW